MGYKEDIYLRIEMTGLNSSQILHKLREDRNGNIVRGATPGLRNLSNQFADISSIQQRIDDADGIAKLSDLKNEVDNVELNNARKDLLNKIKDRVKDLEYRQEKPATYYRNDIKEANNEREVDYALSKAHDELGDGKNYDSLVEAAEFRNRQIRNEREENRRRQEEAEEEKERLRESGVEPDF